MLIIGNGGHAKVIRDLIDLLPTMYSDSYAVIAIGDNHARKREAENHGAYSFPILIHPKASVSRYAKIGKGTVIMAGAVVQADAVIGDFCILNTLASADHDTRIGNFVHLAPGARLCGGVVVGEGSLVGVGVSLPPMSEVPEWTLVKAFVPKMRPL